jgi:exonuclease SbcC
MKPLKLFMNSFGAYADAQLIDFTLLGDRNFFLIHGPTGSGKTTILDAITFALYGTASGDLRETKNLRSDYAPPSSKTQVDFSFRSGAKEYLVVRTPEQEAAKARGTGTRKLPATAALYGLDGGDEKNLLATGVSEVTKQVETIIGFKAEQFRQIVLLPQGEFRAFWSRTPKIARPSSKHFSKQAFTDK